MVIITNYEVKKLFNKFPEISELTTLPVTHVTHFTYLSHCQRQFLVYRTTLQHIYDTWREKSDLHATIQHPLWHTTGL